MRFSENLIHARESRGLTVQDLADLTRLSSHVIEAWETGESYPLFDEMKKLSRALKLDAETLIPDEEMDQYISFSLTCGSQASAAADMLFVGALLVCLVPGFLTSSFAVGAAGAVVGTIAGILLRKHCIKKQQR